MILRTARHVAARVPLARRPRSSRCRRRRLPYAAAVLLAAVSVTAASAAPPREREYTASLAYARCMRAHGVPQPDPDRNGDIHLTRADERRLRRVGRAKVRAVDKLCFRRHLKGVVSTQPLSPWAQMRAKAVLRELSRCMRAYGYRMGRPIVRNLSEGRAFFGFDRAPDTRGRPVSAAERARLARSQRICERRVDLARRIDAIVKADRAPV